MKKLTTFIAAFAVTSALLIATFSGRPSHPTSDKEIAATTAMITNMKGNSGGTGVILTSRSSESTVLTNAHVCQVAKYGGIVTTNTKKGTVTSYKVSEVHDLCLITTNVDLGVNTEVAENAPEEFSPAIVSGHPALLPTLITRGHFSNKEIIDIMTGVRACTDKDIEAGLGMLCAFLGGIPVIKTYTSQVISSTIMPGSSGSAVFNDSGRIAALVFAGSGQLSYGHVVPGEYLYNFVHNELPLLTKQVPLDNSLDDAQTKPENKLKDACKDNKDTLQYEIVRDWCKYVGTDAIYNQ